MESEREKRAESENHSSRLMSFPGVGGGGASATRSLHLEKTASHDPQICGMKEEGLITEPTDLWYGGHHRTYRFVVWWGEGVDHKTHRSVVLGGHTHRFLVW